MINLKFLAFAGSLRTESWNKKLLHAAVAHAKRLGAEITEIDLKDFTLPVYDQDIEDRAGIPLNAQKLKELFLDHQGFLISSPEYNSSVSGVLKNTIDWVSRPTKNEKPLECFAGKVAAILSTSPGQLGDLRGLVHLRSMLENIGTLVVPIQASVPNSQVAFDIYGNLVDKASLLLVENAVESLLDIGSRLHNQGQDFIDFDSKSAKAPTVRASLNGFAGF